ncbi:Reticulon-like protein B18 [Hibiscus syriacus]|uniref:Reticulon-like protein n=1 Tax=Hibiscus syriacus TaxID=106335 RepID=A0A6A2XMI8_HIBSY|nr:reticulon-like protein B18 [Hibiscus syriacus]KAE8668185.1 Reticulon-like protein B18 [Hibiscus syriacus]
MDPISTPPSNAQSKSVSRLARIGYSSVAGSGERERPNLPLLSLDHISPSPKKVTTPASPSPLSLRSSTSSLPLHELLLLSPGSPLRKSTTRLTDRIEMAEEVSAAEQGGGYRRNRKTRAAQTGVLGCGTPRNSRRSRRRMEMELRDERDLILGEEMVKQRKRRHSGKPKKEKPSLVPSLPSSSLSPKADDCEKSNLDRIGEMITDMVMWTDVAKSSLWFGFGCLCFLSSFFTKGVTFSIFSVLSHIGLLFLGVSFFSNSVCHNVEKKNEFNLREEDFLTLAKLVLPATNLAISVIRKLFSGEPSMTLKVAPLLFLGAEYGHIITLWRLCAFGFFISFTMPKLYSCYYSLINQKAEYMKQLAIEAWGACSRKKLVAASAATVFWNLSSVKTRVFIAFIALAIIRYCRQHLRQDSVEGETEEVERDQSQKALVVAGE